MASNFVDQVREAASYLSSPEQMLGKGLNIPNNATNSGGRKIMGNTHQSHSLVLTRGEIPYVATGYENRFGERSSSIIQMDDDYEVIAKISKFSYAPNHHYYLILRNLSKNELTVVERVSYKYVTEVYGYLHNNAIMDNYSNPGTIIHKGDIIRRSTGFDQYGNKTSGRNINVAYMALDNNMEDSVVISSRCSDLLSAPLLRTVKIIINENDIPLNIYGNDDMYKVYPDIGEDVKDGILMAYRRDKKEEAIYTQSVKRLQEIMMSDDKITIKGKVIDINIYCNNPEYIKTNAYNQQFLAYYEDRQRMNQEIVNVVGTFATQGYSLSYDLNKMFYNAKAELEGKKFIDKKQFSNITIEFVVMENRKLGVGDKVSDRYGGKGVVSKIVDTELMPKMYNGQPIDMIKNSSTMYNRENAGQIFEHEINYISMNILDRIREGNMSLQDAFDDILKFLSLQSPQQCQDMSTYINSLDYRQQNAFLESILSKTCINVSNNPISETMNIDKLITLYKAFPWIDEKRILVPIVDSRGNYRFIPTRRPMIAAPQYVIRLKQFAEEKFSAASLSSTNLKNENAKSKASKNYREPNSNTPIKLGQMESGDLDHMGTEYVVINLLLHSLSPNARRLVEQIAINDPYNVNVQIDTTSKNRSAEILNARLKIMGYKITFSKKRKIKRYPMMQNAVEFLGNPNGMTPAVEFMDEGYDFDHWYKTVDEIKKISSMLGFTIDAVSFSDDMEDVQPVYPKDDITEE